MARADRPAPRSPARRRRGVLGAGVGLATLAVGTWFATRPPEPTCTGERARARLDEVWNDERRAELAEGLAESGLPKATTLLDAVDGGVADYGRRWVSEQIAVCRARDSDRTTDGASLDARVACLGHGLQTMDQLLWRITSADVSLASRAIEVVHAVPDPADCAEARLDLEDDPVRGRALRMRLASAEADRLAGRHDAALEDAAALVEDARAADLPVTVGDALEIVGRSWAALGDDRRWAPLEEAYALATARHDDVRAARRASTLALEHARAGHPKRAEQWLGHADAASSEATEHVRGVLQLEQGRSAEAIEHLERARAGRASTRPTTDALAWRTSADLAEALEAAGRTDAAYELTDALHRQTVEDLGEHHPRLVELSLRLGRLEAARGRHEEALEHTQAAIERAARIHGGVHPITATAYLARARLHHDRGALRKAEQAYHRALSASRSTRDPLQARILEGFARLRLAQQRPDVALVLLQEGMSIAREVWDENDPERLRLRRTLAEALVTVGRSEDAEALGPE